MNAEPTDPGRLARARAGDAAALTELYQEYGQQVLDVAFRITGSGDEAQDVLQDVFIGLPEALRSYDRSGPLDAWLRRIAARAALVRLRTDRRRLKWHQKAAEDGPDSAEPVATEARLTLERVLDRMPEEFRTVYVLREIEGYSHDEIAELIGISPNLSSVRLHRARRFLKDRLRGRI